MEQPILISTEEGAINLKWRLKLVFLPSFQDFTTYFGSLIYVGFVLVAHIYLKGFFF
jgi:hypothetical protein